MKIHPTPGQKSDRRRTIEARMTLVLIIRPGSDALPGRDLRPSVVPGLAGHLRRPHPCRPAGNAPVPSRRWRRC